MAIRGEFTHHKRFTHRGIDANGKGIFLGFVGYNRKSQCDDG
jgi:hypothetical protein